MRNLDRAKAAAWMCAAGMAACLPGAHEVATVEELVVAIAAVNGGDADTTVRIAPGYYDVSGCAMDAKGCLSVQKNMALVGADATSWRETADRNAKVVLDAKYARSVFNVDPSLTGVSFRHLTIQNGTNTNAKASDGAGAGIQHGWYKGKYATVSNCVFRGNMGEGQGGGGHTLNLYDCYFTNNVALEGGAALMASAQDCLFEYNRAVANGGALRNGTGLRRCVFVGNVAEESNGGCNYGDNYSVQDCLCVGNVAVRGGGFAADKAAVVSNSTFTGCLALKEGGAAYNATLVDCVVSNCLARPVEAAGGVASAAGHRLTRVAFIDCGCETNDAWRVAATGCHVEDGSFLRCNPATVKSAVRCRIEGGGVFLKGSLMQGGAWTNCLFTGLAASYLFSGAPSLVNCTVVSNNWGTKGQLFAGQVAAVNCIFKDNYHDPNAGKSFDIAGYATWSFTNCVWRTHPGWNSTYTIADTGSISETENLFLAPTHPDYDARHPYALSAASPARNAGAAFAWDDAARDLAGNPRVFLRDGVGRVDVGCYEYSLLPRGTLLIFR